MRLNKHNSYHRIPVLDNNLLDLAGLVRRYKEEERFDFIKRKLDFRDKVVLDIGCNTGFFLPYYLKEGARRVIAFEGSPSCRPILEQSFSGPYKKNIDMKFDYFDFENLPYYRVDITILLNVMHHIGDDFNENISTKKQAKKKLIDYVNSLSSISDFLVFQMGFNWQADISQCLFENGTKGEMIDFIKSGTKRHWHIESVGVPFGVKQNITYNDLDDKNSQRFDSLGEFLNRPIFILSSKS